MQPNGHHLHEHIFLKASISSVCVCVHVQSRKPGANASRQIGGTRWESRTFLRDDKPSQSHTSTGMLGKQTRVGGWDAGWEAGRWEMSEQEEGRDTRDEERVSLH